MRPLHARYPFLEDARAAVEAADVDLVTVAREDRAVVDRALDRIEGAIDGHVVGPPVRQARVELLSYPIARVLISLVDEPALTRAYARAEAATAHERFVEEFSGADLKSTRDDRLTMERLLAEFDLSVESVEEPFGVPVASYLGLAADREGREWRLVGRALADGVVHVTREELLALLEGAVRRRVAEGLPFGVPDPVAEALAEEAETVRDLLADVQVSADLDTVVPERFPPCVTHLVERARAGEELPDHSRFAVTAFLASIGMEAEAVADRLGVDGGAAEAVRSQVEHVRDEEGTPTYAPPSCATMQAYGDCVNKDELCTTIVHPLSYYEENLRRGGEAGEAD